jgi:hypothetical protein
LADPEVEWKGYFASIYYNAAKTLDMRDSGVIIAGMLATAATVALIGGPGGVAIGGAMFAIDAGAAANIAVTASNAVGDGRCLQVDVPSMMPDIINC